MDKPEPTGGELAEQGGQTAVAHADRLDLHWSSNAFAKLLEYVRRLQVRDPDKRFTSEDVRDWSYGQGLSRPPDERAWGPLMNRARRGGKIIGTSEYADAKAKHAHCSPKRLYRVGEP